MLIQYRQLDPHLHETVYLSPGACVIGKVTVGASSSIWFGSVVRGDVAPISIGNGVNIQDGTIIHTSRFDGPTNIGNYVTIGHRAVIHACTLKDYAFIGMGAIVMDRAVVESYGFVAAGAVVSPGKIVKSKQLWAGVPAKYVRDVTDDEISMIEESAKHYMRLAEHYIGRN